MSGFRAPTRHRLDRFPSWRISREGRGGVILTGYGLAAEPLESLDELRDRQLHAEGAPRFRYRYPRLDRIPIFGSTARILYGAHSLKYNSYVEPALHMAEHDDPLRYQRPYQAGPGNPESSGRVLFDCEWENVPTEGGGARTVRAGSSVVG